MPNVYAADVLGLQYKAICNHISDSLAVTQDNANYYCWLFHRLKEKYTGWLIELSDFPLITNQGTGLFMTTHR